MCFRMKNREMCKSERENEREWEKLREKEINWERKKEIEWKKRQSKRHRKKETIDDRATEQQQQKGSLRPLVKKGEKNQKEKKNGENR